MKQNKIKKIIIILAFLTLVSPKPSYAWWADFPGNGFGATLEEMFKQIGFAMTAALQQAAVQTIDQTVNNAIGGGVNGPLFIQDWTDFLINQPGRDVQLYTNNLLTQIYQGRDSALNYSYSMNKVMGPPASSNYVVQALGDVSQNIDPRVSTLLRNEGIGGNYFSSGLQMIKNRINTAQIPAPDIQNYVKDGNPRNMFAQSNWKAASAWFGNPINDINMGLQATVLDPVKQNMTEQMQKVAATEGSAYGGYKPVTKNGQVVTPGSTIEAIQANSLDLGNKIIANAQSIPQVMAALVTRLMTKTITQGIGDAQMKVQKEINTNIRDAKTKINNSVPQNTFQLSY